jgi:CRP-like cAMP-binding protein
MVGAPEPVLVMLCWSGQCQSPIMQRAGSKPLDFLEPGHTGPGRSAEFYKQKQPVFAQGDPADSIFYLQEGQLTLTIISRQGKEAVISILGPGDFFGEDCLTGQPFRTSTAIAITRCSVMKLDRDAMVRLVRAEPGFSEFFILRLISRNARLEEALADQLVNSSEKRLARVLLLLCRLANAGENQGVVPRVSQQVLADMVGTTRSRVSYFMNKFRKQGFIEYRREFRINTSLLKEFLSD